MVRRGQVRERLLHCASRRYARDGVGRTSVRCVIQDAGANLNAVHYHFGSHEALVDAVADRALAALNEERFARFDRVESGLASEGGCDDTVRAILDAGYGPLFDQALGRERERTRPGLLVVGQLRHDPLGPELVTMNDHSDRFVERIESLLRRHLPSNAGRLRGDMQLVNAAAWDSALRPDVLARVEAARSPRASLRSFARRFLDFAVAGLTAPPAGANR